MATDDTLPVACPMTPVRAVSAAQYVRMSTDQQQYSPLAQKQAIADYAESHGITIVSTYEDSGLSGLTLRERPGLQRLLLDVRNADREFDTVLVFDVSRWGRFQDTDEAAYHEHECRRVGVRVIYCSEQFENDSSPFASVYKSIKRAMAGEFSRELSAKVFAGQCRLVRLGFWQGSTPGLGLRRMLVNMNRDLKAPLAPFEYKSIHTDRVVLVPGPANEVALVRRIFDWYVNGGISTIRIARRLNDTGVYNAYDRPWSTPTIRRLLMNEKYLGNNVYNRSSMKLHAPRVSNLPSEWIRAVGAFGAIVEPAVFEAAQVRLTRYARGVVEAETNAELKRLWESAGYLNVRTMAQGLSVNGKSGFAKRFGCMANAYRSVGFKPTCQYDYVDLRRQAHAVFHSLIEAMSTSLSQAGLHPALYRCRTLLQVNNELSVKFTARLTAPRGAGARTWTLKWPGNYPVDLMVIVLFSRMPVQVDGFYVFPRGVVLPGKVTVVCPSHIPALRRFYVPNLDMLRYLAERSALEAGHE
ncbi:recombinase family protein [Paraburkholderia caledonica]